jgi:hypothetical protein
MSRLVRSALPGRLAQLFHLGLPLAVQFAVLGWWRSAAWALAIAAFGSWGLTDRWLESADSAHSSWRRLVRLARAAAATVASVVPFVLVLDLFFHILGAPPKS